MSPSEFEDLVARYFDGDLDDAGLAALDDALQSDAQAAARFEELLTVEGGLRARAATGEDVEELLRRTLMSVPTDESDVALARSVLSSVSARRSRIGTGKRRKGGAAPWLPFAVVSIAAAVVLAAILFSRSPDPKRRSRTQEVAARRSPVSAEGVWDATGPEEPVETDSVEADAAPTVALPLEDEQPDLQPQPAIVAFAPTEGGVDDKPETPADERAQEPVVAAEPRREVHVGYLDSTEGLVEWSRSGEEWSAAMDGGELRTGDRLRTKLSRARFVFESGAALWVNRFTTLTFGNGGETRGLFLVGGEVFVALRDGDSGFCVETKHGRARDLGTRFGVKVGVSGTRVVVVEGEVEASTDVASATVKSEQEVLLARRTSPPGRVRRSTYAKTGYAWVPGKKFTRPVARYQFAEGRGDVVMDTSGNGEALNLKIAVDGGRARWVRGGLSLEVPQVALVSDGPATKITKACKLSKEFTVMAWVAPAARLSGVGRIVTISDTGGDCTNFSLGLKGSRPELWCNITTKDFFGGEEIVTSPGPIAGTLTHIVIARDSDGNVTYHVNGVQLACWTESGAGTSPAAPTQLAEGDFSTWLEQFPLAIGNRPHRDAQWLGTLYEVAIYDSVLAKDEVESLYRAGTAHAGPRRR